MELLAITRKKSISVKDRLEIAHTRFKDKTFTRKEYLQLFKEISAPTASRDLRYGVDKKLLKRKGDLRLSQYSFSKVTT